MSNTEPVDTLKAFYRSTEGVDAPVIQYPKLPTYADEANGKEKALWHEFWSSPDDTVEEEDRARAAARGYFVLTALQLQQAPERDLASVSKRFTEAAVELYGKPDITEVRRLAANQYHELTKLLSNKAVEQDRLNHVLEFLRTQLGEIPAVDDQTNEKLNDSLDAIKGVFETQFADALQVFKGLEAGSKSLSAAQVKELFEEAKAILESKEPAWQQWSVNFADKKTMGSDDKQQAIEIGEKGSYSPARLKRLFIEEVLVHSLRSVNGSKTQDYMLEHGLPSYLDAEEGLAKFIQLAMGDEIGERTKDFYMDTAFALGELDRPPISRPELCSIYIDKEIVRQQAKGEAVDYEDLKDRAWRYVNRIYRGSLGNEYIAVNTKDIAYYHGFLKISRYIEEKLAAGVAPAKLLDYLLAAKFDPTNSRHVEYLKRFNIEFE